MSATESHRNLAAKFALKWVFSNTLVADSLVALVAHTYTEEEAAIVCHLGLTPVSARHVARRARRPREEVEPILRSLDERVLILGTKLAGVKVYGFMVMVPGVFEAQMVRAKVDPENQEYYREFARLYHQVHEEYATWIRPRVKDRDIHLSRIIAVEKSIEVTHFDNSKYISISRLRIGNIH